MQFSILRMLLASAAGLAGAVMLLVLAAAAPAQDEPAYVGTELCAECHVAQHATFQGTLHDDLLEGFADEPGGVGGCEACHGPGSAHVEMAGSEEPGWRLAIDSSPDPDACRRCHTEVIGQFSLVERHPVLEGFMRCADCHDPHGTTESRFLRGALNETCTSCHADKAGPFVFPHPVAETEGCVACHTPHGSTNPHMLSYREVTFVCLGCHAFQPTFHTQPGFADCTACHYAIHGSNLDPHFLE